MPLSTFLENLNYFRYTEPNNLADNFSKNTAFATKNSNIFQKKH